MKRTTTVGARRSRVVAAIVAGGMLVAACGGDDGGSSEPAATQAPAPADTDAPADTGSGDTTAPAETTAPADELGPPTGPEMVVGMVNTEGGAGLDFPDIRRFIEAAVEYTNQHGGLGNRPIKLETCIANGSPETSQACAQELVGKNVELVLLGLDLFPDYKTYEAASTPIIGVLPILPIDYTANALFLTGGNATSQAAIAAVAKEYYSASNVSIIHADNAGANSTAASLQAALDKAGIAWEAVKGGDNETDAGYQGLVREAAAGDPDVIVSLYADAGCIGVMRGRASLGITTPVITTNICADRDVIDAVGDDALGWMFAGLPEEIDSPERTLQRELLAPVLGIDASEVTNAGLGLGGLGYSLYMSLVQYGNQMVEQGIELTGQSLYDFVKSGEGLYFFGGVTPLACGASAAYPAVCSFVFPFAEYKGDGVVGPVDGLGLVDSLPYLP